MRKKTKIREDLRDYVVETGKYKKTVEAGSLEGAVISAFILWPPKELSFLTRVREKRPLKQKRGDERWHYINTIEMLKKAGYSVNKS